MEQLALRGFDVTFVTYVKYRDTYQVPSCIKRKYIHGVNKIVDRINLARFMWSFSKDDIVIACLSVNFRDVVLPVLFLDRTIIAGERNLTRSQNFTRRLVFQLERKAKASSVFAIYLIQCNDNICCYVYQEFDYLGQYFDASSFCIYLIVYGVIIYFV